MRRLCLVAAALTLAACTEHDAIEANTPPPAAAATEVSSTSTAPVDLEAELAKFDFPILKLSDPPGGSNYRDFQSQQAQALKEKTSRVKASLATGGDCGRFTTRIDAAAARLELGYTMAAHQVDVQTRLAAEAQCFVFQSSTQLSGNDRAALPPSASAAKPAAFPEPGREAYVVVPASAPVCRDFKDAVRVASVLSMGNDTALMHILSRSQCEISGFMIAISASTVKQLDYGVSAVSLDNGVFYFPTASATTRSMTKTEAVELMANRY